MPRIRVFWRLGKLTAKRIAPDYTAGTRRDSDQLAGTREFIRGKESPLSLLLSVPTDVYRLQSAPTEPRVIAVAHGDSRLIVITRDCRAADRPLDLSRDSNLARCTCIT